jgi:hypothetical protein
MQKVFILELSFSMIPLRPGLAGFPNHFNEKFCIQLIINTFAALTNSIDP